MAIKQTIQYNSSNSYFAGFLQNIIDKTEINGSVSQEKNITLVLDETDTQKLEEFSELVDKTLPYSLFLGDISTTNENTTVSKSDFISESYDISLCPICLEKLTNPSSNQYLDDTLVCTHYKNEVKTYDDFTTFSPHYTQGCSVLVTNSSKVDELFIMTEDEKKALFSIEKPIIKVTIKDETLKQMTGKLFIDIKSPYNTRSTLAALNAKESEVDYLFFTKEDDLKVTVVQKNINIIHDANLSRKLKSIHQDSTINRFLNISEEADFTKDSIAASMSLQSGISFVVQNENDVKKVVEFQKFNLENTLTKMKADTTRGKLLENLFVKYPSIEKELEENLQFNIFETICTILELELKSYESFSDKSLEFRGNGGLKIDMYFDDEGFDYVALLGSIISFKLAGVDTHFLAYSIFEAYGDMIITTLNQLKEKFKIENFIMMGDMFENSVLHSRILSKFQLSNPYFSKSIALDD